MKVEGLPRSNINIMTNIDISVSEEHADVLLIFQSIENKFGISQSQSQSQSYFTTDSQSVSMSWCRTQSGTFDQRSYFFVFFVFESYCLVTF
jgi:hypothetical protein